MIPHLLKIHKGIAITLMIIFIIEIVELVFNKYTI